MGMSWWWGRFAFEFGAELGVTSEPLYDVDVQNVEIPKTG
jgi:hypothetical protein